MRAADVNRPEVVQEVTAAFERYESALMDNDVDVLNELFWRDGAVVRFGVLENLYGWDEIAQYRRERPPAVARVLRRTAVTAFGEDTAVAVTEYDEHAASQTGRQTQVWVRLDGDWRIVSAHVSLPPVPGSTDQI